MVFSTDKLTRDKKLIFEKYAIFSQLKSKQVHLCTKSPDHAVINSAVELFVLIIKTQLVCRLECK